MKTPTAKKSPTDRSCGVVVKSDDGGVCFRLRPTRSGLLVQRDRRRKDNHARLVQSVVFATSDGFARWCAADSVRFDYPIVFSAIRREGGALLQHHEQASGAERDQQAS